MIILSHMVNLFPVICTPISMKVGHVSREAILAHAVDAGRETRASCAVIQSERYCGPPLT